MKTTTTISFILILFTFTVYAQKTPTTRQMNLINWMEFQEVVPSNIETVLFPVGVVESHGVIPNGADNLAPEAMSKEIAERLNALIAPTLYYGITPRRKGYGGTITISEKSFKPFVEEIITELAENKFKNIIILNGHGGNAKSLNEIATAVSHKMKVRIMVINWWSLASKATFEVFGENGGHAGNNETAYIQAIVPQHIHPERYTKDMAMAYPSGGAVYTIPNETTIGLYNEGEGYPTFDEKQAHEYFKKVNDIVADYIQKTIQKWDKAKLYR